MVPTVRELRKRAEPSLNDRVGSAYGVLITAAIIMLIVPYILHRLGSLALVGGLGLNQMTDALLRLMPFSGNGWVSDRQFFVILADFLKSLPKLMIFGYIITWIINSIIRIFLQPQLELGSMRWFARNREQSLNPDFSLLFSMFKRNNYWSATKGAFWREFLLFLWRLPSFLLRVIGFFYFCLILVDELRQLLMSWGTRSQIIIANHMVTAYFVVSAAGFFVFVWGLFMIYKRLQYSFVFWLLADQPQLDPSRAIKLSKKMSEGHKWLIIKIYLRYFIYHFLAVFTLVFYFLLRPLINTYRTAVLAELYAIRRDQIVAAGDITMEDLGYRLVQPQDTEYFSASSEQSEVENA